MNGGESFYMYRDRMNEGRVGGRGEEEEEEKEEWEGGEEWEVE